MKRTWLAETLLCRCSVRLLCGGLVLAVGAASRAAPADGPPRLGGPPFEFSRPTAPPDGPPRLGGPTFEAASQAAPAQPGALPSTVTTEEAPPPRPEPGQLAPRPALVLSVNDALRYAIEHNPTLATVRKSRGIAAAGIVIADTYPFNPIFQHFVWGGNGPAAAGVTNHVFNEHTMRLDVELFHQGRYRRALAAATLTRTEWDIAREEVRIGILVVRDFNSVLLRQEQVRLGKQAVQLQEQVLKQIETLVEKGTLPRTELMLARTNLSSARVAMLTAESDLTVAWNVLRRDLGMINEECALTGTLETAAPDLVASDLILVAEERRPDLRSLETAIKEADATLRFTIANRWGNPSIGPATEVNETSVTFVGMWLIWSPPIINTRKGEILQARARVAQAIQAASSQQIMIQQEVYAALARLKKANAVVNELRSKTLPEMRRQVMDMDKLFAAGEPGTTFATLIASRTQLITTYNTYLTALFALADARADLAAAIGDPSLVQLGAPRPQLAAANGPPTLTPNQTPAPPAH